jgi:hypothetical protein
VYLHAEFHRNVAILVGFEGFNSGFGLFSGSSPTDERAAVLCGV